MVIEYSTLALFKPFLLGYCNCGCGEELQIVRWDRFPRFKYTHNLRGEYNPNWKGETEHRNYVLIRMPEHPNADKQGYVYKHVLVVSNHIGRPLKKGEVVHHIDKDTKNNDISNLQLLNSQGEHMSITLTKNMDDRICAGYKCDRIGLNNRQWHRYGDNQWLCHKCGERERRRLAKYKHK